MAINDKVYDFLENNKKLIQDKKILMIGRQSNYLSKKYLKHKNIKNSNHSESIWKKLGCKKIESIDFSEYESPTYIHDMNKKINNDFYNRFDLIYDGGSTEHVFNIPNAFNNYINMLTLGGTYIGVLPGNNLCNHGFYQFSPDFFYRFFSIENGFTTKIYAKIKNNWFHIKDLKDFQYPIHFNLDLGKGESLLYIVAKKVNKRHDYDFIPYQTIYSSWLWDNQKNNIDSQKSHLFNIVDKVTPQFIKNYIWQYRNHKLILNKVNKPQF